ncbi:MFS transporter (plasmid) [Streptomyces sp. NBC_01724]|uniref:MFS transporter n=1 Tax=Streptomyces sp. NBC_01724 TaxID=2975922 RepID=UPI002E2FAD24|nr:MFS transporter [Streptomyces sp. NBC_01724]
MTGPRRTPPPPTLVGTTTDGPENPPEHQPRSRWGLLTDRNFRLLWIGETVSKLGSSITTLALPLVAVVRLDAGSFTVGLLTAAVWVPWVLLGLPVGVWVGRLPRRAVMLTCNLVSLSVLASLPLVDGLGALTMTHLLLAALVAGTASVFFTTAYQVVLPELVGQGDLVEGNAKLQGGAAAAQVAGPGAAGLIAQGFGAVFGLLADSITFLVSTVTLLMMRSRREAQPKPAPAPASLRGDVVEGLKFIARDSYLRTLTAFGATANLALAGYQSILVPFLIREVGVQPGAVGALAAAGALGGILGAVVATPVARRFGAARGALVSQIIAAPCGLLLPMTTGGASLVLFVFGSVALVTGATVSNVIFGSFRQNYTPPELLSRVVATSMFVNHSTIPLGALLGGLLGSAIGLRPTMWIATGLLVLAGAMVLASPLRRHRDFPARRADS